MRSLKTFNLSLKTRILFVLLGVVSCYGAIDYSIQALIVYPRFLSLEADFARRDMERCTEAISREIAHLESLTHDWSAWNDIYRFMQGDESDFVSSNIVSDTYEINQLNLIYVVALDGTVAAGNAWDLAAGAPMDIPEFPPLTMSPENFLLVGSHGDQDPASSVSGVVETGAGLMLVSAWPILTSSNEGPSMGTLIMGQFLSDEKIQALIEQIRIRFDVFSVQADSLPDEARKALTSLLSGVPAVLRIQDKNFLNGYAMMPDVQGKPALLIRARLSREISSQGIRALWRAVLSIVVTAVAVLLALNATLKRVVVAPIHTLIRHVTRITETDDLTTRLNMPCHHEIGSLANAFDRMVDRLAAQTGKISATNIKLVGEIQERRRTEAMLKKSETFLQAILDTIQNGILMINPESGNILYANPYAAFMMGEKPEALIGRSHGEIMNPIAGTGITAFERYKGICRDDCLLTATTGRKYHIRRLRTTLERDGNLLILESFQDISDIKHLLEKQEIHISTAQRLLHLTNGLMPRHVALPEKRQVFMHALSAPCYALGGDHFFARVLLPAHRTVISLKDQSGHEVESVLKAIGTDLVHQSLLCKHEELPLDAIITEVNRQICTTGLLGDDEFFTSITLDIDHETLVMHYLSTGHPPFLLIRGETVRALPQHGEAGANLPCGFLEDIFFTSAELQLLDGDRLILYSDGLTEMPVGRTGSLLETGRLLELTRKILSGAPGKTVSEIMAALLHEVSELSAQNVVPFEKNTSNDDVTLIGIEIENIDTAWEASFRPRSANMLASAVSSVTDNISIRYRLPREAPLYFRIHAFLEEGMINAWRHGNRCNPEKSITVRCFRRNDLRIDIIDEGQGLDIANLQKPTGPENRLKTFGRGIFIMKHMADEVSWEDGGRHVVAFFRLPGDTES